MALMLAADASGEGSKSNEDEDEKLLEEYYLKFKGPGDDKKYNLIPKFYSKVNASAFCQYSESGLSQSNTCELILLHCGIWEYEELAVDPFC